MPTKKPKVQIILNEDIYKKFKTLADSEIRTESQLGGYIITKYIEAYEAEHGEIIINEQSTKE